MREKTRRCFTHPRSGVGVIMNRDVGLILGGKNGSTRAAVTARA